MLQLPRPVLAVVGGSRHTIAIVCDAVGPTIAEVVVVDSVAEAFPRIATHHVRAICVECGPESETYGALDLLRELAQRDPAIARLAVVEQDSPAALLEALVNECAVLRVLAKPLSAERVARAVLAAMAATAATEPPHASHRGAAPLATTLADAPSEASALVSELESRVSLRTAQLERAKREWESTFDAISTPIALVSADHVVRRANLAYAAAARRPVREVPGTRCYETLFGRSKPCLGCSVGQRLGASDLAAEHAVARTDPARTGDGRLLRASTFPADVAFADGSVCIYEDVTDEARQRLAALEAAKALALAQLAAGVAHEFNNPLTGIFAVAQLMAYEPNRSASDQQNLNLIEESARRCRRIVDDLVAFADQSSSELREFDVRDPLLEAVEQFRTALADEASVTFDVDLPADLGRVTGASDQIRRLLLNLLTNARQALPRAGGRIAVDAVVVGADIRIRVADNGVGIDPDTLPSIFNPLFSTRPVGSCVGLGLAVAYSIARAHGGEIRVESREGVGTTFTVVLPARGPWLGRLAVGPSLPMRK